MSQGPDLSIVIPVFEEQATIVSLIEEIVSTFEATDWSFEIVVVDDGSRDDTYARLESVAGQAGQKLRLVQHLTNRGNGAALRSGIRVSRGDIVVTMDADGQHAPADILKLLEKIPPNDLVIAARLIDYQGPWYRNWANTFYNRFASWLSGRSVLDLTSGFRAMRRHAVLHFLPLFPNGFSAPTTTTLAFLKAGYNVVFVPIQVRPRQQGKSKIRLWQDGSNFMLIILRMITMYDPLRIFLPMGFGLGVLGLIAGAAGIIQAGRLVLANSAIFLFTAAVLTWLLGLVSSQVSSTLISYHGDETLMVDGQPANYKDLQEISTDTDD